MQGKYKEDFDVPLKYDLLSFTSKPTDGTFSYMYLQQLQNEQDLEEIVEEDADVDREDRLYSFDERRKMILNTIFITSVCIVFLVIGIWYLTTYNSRQDEEEAEEKRKEFEEKQKVIKQFWEKLDLKKARDADTREAVIKEIIKGSDAVSEKLV